MSLKAFKSILESFRSKSWTIKVIPNRILPKRHQEISVFHLTGIDILRVGLIGVFLLTAMCGYVLLKRAQDVIIFKQLKSSLAVKDQQLSAAEGEKAQVETMLDQRANHLESNLAQLRLQEEEIKRLLGRKSKKIMMRATRVALYQSRTLHLSRFAERSSRGAPGYNQLIRRISSLERQISDEENELSEIQTAAMLEHQRMEQERARLSGLFDRIPSLWPANGYISSGFGYRTMSGEGEFHQGVDIATSYSSPIHAAASGRCILSGYDRGFGLTVKVDHGNGFVTQYSHCSQVLAREGEFVRKGELVGLVGSTGYSTGPHVHYQMFYHGNVIDPAPYLGLTVDDLAARSDLRAP